jgi:hypothetical protein
MVEAGIPPSSESGPERPGGGAAESGETETSVPAARASVREPGIPARSERAMVRAPRAES